MNNEEKILGMLETMQGQMETMQNQLDNVQGTTARLEQRADAMQDQLNHVQETATRVALTQENTVMNALHLLAEGHTTIMDRMPSKSRIEALEEEVSTLKSIVQFHTAEIAELKAAK